MLEKLTFKYPKEFPIKLGDRFVVGCCFWQQPGWTESHPGIVFSPVLQYREVNSAESLIEDTLIDAVVHSTLESDDDIIDVNENLSWAGTSLKTLERRIKNSIESFRLYPEKCKLLYENRYSEIIVQEVEIIDIHDNENDREVLDWKIIEELVIKPYNT